VKALLYEKFGGPIRVCNVSDPTVPPDGVIVGVKASGICRSDWHGWMGHDPDIRLPHVPGHEFSGVVEEVGADVRRFKAGDRVTVPFAVGCGKCDQCLAGNQHICDDYFQPGFTAWGSFAERVAIPHADTNLVGLPADLDDVAAASLGCRFVTAFRAVVAQGRASPGEWVAVHGCGGVGLAAIMIAHSLGARVIAIDIKPEALNWAKSVGAVHVLNARSVPNIEKAIQDLSGRGVHLSLDALGSRETCRNSILCLRKQGRHVQVGLMLADDREAPVPMAIVIAKELAIYGSHGMQAHAYGPMLAMIQSGQLQPKRLVTKTITLSEAPAELGAMGQFSGLGITVVDRF
jgi:alcohol dehydrogenase